MSFVVLKCWGDVKVNSRSANSLYKITFKYFCHYMIHCIPKEFSFEFKGKILYES